MFYIIYFFFISIFYMSMQSQGFLCGSAGKESACNVRDLGSIPGLGRSPGEEKGYPLQYSGLENSVDCTVHRVAKSWTRLSDFHSHLHAILYHYTHSTVKSETIPKSFGLPIWEQIYIYISVSVIYNIVTSYKHWQEINFHDGTRKKDIKLINSSFYMHKMACAQI